VGERPSEADPSVEGAWRASGVAGLVGREEGPVLLPAPATMVAIEALVADAAVTDALALLGERAALSGLSRHGSTSCGAATRLVPAADGWLAVALARPDDVDLLPAWLEVGNDGEGSDPWALVARVVSTRPAADLVDRAGLLGLPVARLGEAARSAAPVLSQPYGARPPLGHPPLVVDLSSLWAGPLCSHLLALEGARVVKVESTTRPDGARADRSGFFDLLNHGKSSVALDLSSAEGVTRLRDLLAAADVVVEGSRPRALRQWGIEAEALLATAHGPRVWVSITGHGRVGPAGARVGFGDDAAVAGGLVVGDAVGPCFLADAVADPLAGIAAAAAVTEALAKGGAWLLDVALARVAASVAGPDWTGRAIVGPLEPPRARPVPGPARPLGADTVTVLGGLR
jgi:hypothetical protein